MTLNERIFLIKQQLKQQKITYEELSQKSGIPLNTLKNIFRGRTANPRLDTMQAIEKALGLDSPKALADSIVTQVDELNIADYNSLTTDEKAKIAEIFNASVNAFKKK